MFCSSKQTPHSGRFVFLRLCAGPNRLIRTAALFWLQDMAIPGLAFKELNMNKDQVNGKLQDIGGKIQEEAGKIVGNTEQQLKGMKNQVEGKTQEKIGDLKEAIKDATN
jgi:uncharacterized protein YjbJ (UPF0337 family)